MMRSVQLRDVAASDLPIFFEQQRDPLAIHMAAFTVKDPADKEAFTAHWRKNMSDETNIMKTILFDGHVAGNISSFELFGEPTVGYWIGREYWGQGVATRALSAFLDIVKVRPLHARAAHDNIASLRVLQKCGFVITGDDKAFANGRGAETEEFILQLSAT